MDGRPGPEGRKGKNYGNLFNGNLKSRFYAGDRGFPGIKGDIG